MVHDMEWLIYFLLNGYLIVSISFAENGDAPLLNFPLTDIEN